VFYGIKKVRAQNAEKVFTNPPFTKGGQGGFNQNTRVGSYNLHRVLTILKIPLNPPLEKGDFQRVIILFFSIPVSGVCQDQPTGGEGTAGLLPWLSKQDLSLPLDGGGWGGGEVLGIAFISAKKLQFAGSLFPLVEEYRGIHRTVCSTYPCDFPLSSRRRGNCRCHAESRGALLKTGGGSCV